jgi:hypothetical protein
VVRVARVPVPAGPRVVPPDRVAPPERPFPARERAAPPAALPRALARGVVVLGSLLLVARLLGARVAMMPTVASSDLSSKDRLRPACRAAAGPAG